VTVTILPGVRTAHRASGIVGRPFQAPGIGVPADNQDTQAILDQLAETGKPYEQDLHLSEIAQLSRLAQPSAAPTAAEPPTNIPLTLTIQTGA
jgi:hypothetical protein